MEGSKRIPIAVTGAGGFIGRVLSSLSSVEVLPVSRGSNIDPRAKALVHLAWHADPSDYLESQENMVSADYAIATALGAAKLGIPFLGVGTCAEYAASISDLVEGDQTTPASVYAREKLRALNTTRAICREFGSTWIWARVFYPFGPGEHPARLVPQVLHALSKRDPIDLGPCDQIRDQIDVRDVAGALAFLALQSAAKTNEVEDVFNVSLSSAIPLRDWLIALAGDEAPLLHFAKPSTNLSPQRVVGDNTRLRSLGWSAKFASPPHWSSLVFDH
jgi:nucleoside-diphosphate-sugar epimerase